MTAHGMCGRFEIFESPRHFRIEFESNLEASQVPRSFRVNSTNGSGIVTSEFDANFQQMSERLLTLQPSDTNVTQRRRKIANHACAT